MNDIKQSITGNRSIDQGRRADEKACSVANLGHGSLHRRLSQLTYYCAWLALVIGNKKIDTAIEIQALSLYNLLLVAALALPC
jgi:hypothetical protein